MKKFLELSILALLLLCLAACSNSGEAPESRRTAMLDGIPVSYLDTGKKDAPALVFIHGWSCDAEFWRLQMPVFSKDYRVIVIDLPGYGQSGKPQDIQYTMELFVKAVHAVIQDAGINSPVLVGHSMGYAVARQYLMDYPGMVKAVVNVDGAYFPMPQSPEELAAFEAETDMVLAGFKGPDRMQAVRMFVESTFYGQTRPELREEIMAVMSSADPYASTSTLEEMFRLDQWREHSFNVPSLAIYAKHDYLPANHEEYMRGVFPNLVYEEWDGVGHYLMLEEPEKFNASLKKFLDGLN